MWNFKEMLINIGFYIFHRTVVNFFVNHPIQNHKTFVNHNIQKS